MNLQQILLQQNVEAKHVGDQSFDTLSRIETKHPQKLCSFLADRRFLSKVSDDVQLVITNEEIFHEIHDKSICVVKNPKLVFFSLHNYLSDKPEYTRQSYNTIIGEGCKISIHALISENNVTIGNNVTIEEFVSIKENTKIGNNVIIRAGSIIGGEGFEQKRNDDIVISIKHSGGVLIKDNVEIQQNCAVDRAIYPWDNTIIGEYCRFDNCVHVGHAVKMKERVLIAASACIAGAVDIGRDVWVGPSCMLSNAIKIGDNARVNIGAVVTKDVVEGESVSGNFAIEHSKFLSFLRGIR